MDVFLDCVQFNEWRFVGGDMSPERKKGIRLEAAQTFARAHGVPWTSQLIQRLAICQRAFLQYDARVASDEAENEKFGREEGATVH